MSLALSDLVDIGARFFSFSRSYLALTSTIASRVVETGLAGISPRPIYPDVVLLCTSWLAVLGGPFKSIASWSPSAQVATRTLRVVVPPTPTLPALEGTIDPLVCLMVLVLISVGSGTCILLGCVEAELNRKCQCDSYKPVRRILVDVAQLVIANPWYILYFLFIDLPEYIDVYRNGPKPKPEPPKRKVISYPPFSKVRFKDEPEVREFYRTQIIGEPMLPPDQLEERPFRMIDLWLNKE